MTAANGQEVPCTGQCDQGDCDCPLGQQSGHGYPEVTNPLHKAARWLGQTHHHDWGLLNEEARRGRMRAIAAEFGPMLDALNHLRLEERMELVGMIPLGGHDPHGRTHYVEDPLG